MLPSCQSLWDYGESHNLGYGRLSSHLALRGLAWGGLMGGAKISGPSLNQDQFRRNSGTITGTINKTINTLDSSNSFRLVLLIFRLSSRTLPDQFKGH